MRFLANDKKRKPSQSNFGYIFSHDLFPAHLFQQIIMLEASASAS